jgi:hypothetical protein
VPMRHLRCVPREGGDWLEVVDYSPTTQSFFRCPTEAKPLRDSVGEGGDHQTSVGGEDQTTAPVLSDANSLQVMSDLPGGAAPQPGDDEPISCGETDVILFFKIDPATPL